MGSKTKTIQLYGFPISDLTAERIKVCVEKHSGERTIYAIQVRLPKSLGPKSRAYADIQFTSSKSAEKIARMAESQRLWYDDSYLKVQERDRDIVPKPITPMVSLEGIVLHFGCQVSNDKFSVLWNADNVKAYFGSDLGRLSFFLSYRDVDYKLELLYESIWRIELRRPRGRGKKFLMIQLHASPRIYKKPPQSSSLEVYDSPASNYFLYTPDYQWVRVTDFTRSCSIGQSSALCLELPHRFDLPDIGKSFFYYKENDGPFVLEKGFSFSCSLDLVPIIEPRHKIKLPYKILFKINSLVQNGVLMGPTLDDDFFRLVDPRRTPITLIEHALESLFNLKNSCFKPAKWLQEKYRSYKTSKRLPRSTAISLEPGLVYIHRALVTPSKIYFCGPEVNISNRVLRNYPEDIDNFLRVSFVDEEWDKIRSMDLFRGKVSEDDEKYTDIYKRILSTLRNGIVIGDKKFEFLAFSSSQLKENSAWMFAARTGVSASGIRNWMGDFSEIRNVAKYAARLGQSFGSSRESLHVLRHEVEPIPDVAIRVDGKKYVFSDGIGKISAEFARRVAKKCDLKTMPSAFQIRYAGYKGVVAVDPRSSFKLSLRKSMCKYKCENTKLDILGWSRYQPCFLNRQVITLLSTLGIKDHVFQMKQKKAVDELDMILTDPVKADEALDLMSPGENTRVLREMLMCGYRPNSEPFLSMMLHTFRESKLLELRTKARIFVPRGRSMMGCLDETRTLEYGQVFVNVSCGGHRQFHHGGIFLSRGNETEQRSEVVEGKVVVAKNPCLHPGDVRVLTAIDVPALRHMVDCVVFPQKGKRPHPNECSGSDLDGDMYFVSWDPDLIPPGRVPPMDYTAEPTQILDHDVSVEEVEEYFTNYMINDSLGIISNAHTVFADREPLKANSQPCTELAKLFSIAVDFAKTGVPAEIPPELQVKEFPDFMEKLDKSNYISNGVIGKLYRAIKDHPSRVAYIKSFTRDVARRSYDSDMEVDGFEYYLDDAYYYKEQYDFKLGNLLEHYGIKSEAELLSGSIKKMSKLQTKIKDPETISLEVNSLKNEARRWFDEKSSDSDENVDDDVYAKASAWYHVTYHPDYWGCYNVEMKRDHYISFPWCVYDKLIHIKKKKKQIQELSAMVQNFGRNLRFS